MANLEDTKASRLFRWQKGETPGPWEILVFPTNRCNQQCRICWQQWAKQEFGKVDYSSELSDERLLRLVDEAAEMGVKEWTIVGGGEPMMRGELVMEMCRKIRAHGMNGTIQTNGTKFTREQLQMLVDIGWEHIVVSLDGPTAEINDAIRGPKSFEKATTNLRILDEIKRKQQALAPQALFNTVVTNLNYDKLDQMLALAHELGCGGMGVGDLQVNGDMCAEFALTDQQRRELIASLPGTIAKAKGYGFYENMAATFTPEVGLGEAGPSTGGGVLANALCYEAWLSLAVLSESGKAGPCCVFWEKDVATIAEHSLAEVWMGPYMQQVREKLKTRRGIPSYCSNCCSHIPLRTMTLRAELNGLWVWDQNPMRFKTWVLIAKRLLSTIKTRGIRQSIKRGREWFITRSQKR